MIRVYRASLNLERLRTLLFKSERVGRSNHALEKWLSDRGFWRDGDHWLGEESALAMLPLGVVTDRGEQVWPQPCRDDPYYDLIFRTAEAEWEFFCRDIEPDRDVWRFVLVEEYAADDTCECRGPVLRAWRRDDAGLWEITESERLDYHRSAVGRRVFPFALITFHIQPSGDRVVLGHRQATTAGIGGQYLVRRNGECLDLVPDPEGGFWRS